MHVVTGQAEISFLGPGLTSNSNVIWTSFQLLCFLNRIIDHLADYRNNVEQFRKQKNRKGKPASYTCKVENCGKHFGGQGLGTFFVYKQVCFIFKT